MQPRTRYADAGGIQIAYQQFGDGQLDVVFVSGAWSHVELGWEMPGAARFLERLGSFARVLHFDKRGCGLSDPVARAPTLEERMDDVRAVMDAAGVERAALVGVSEGAPMSALFAASYPNRTTALCLYGGFGRVTRGEDYPWGWDRDIAEQLLNEAVAHWGEGKLLPLIAPDHAGEPGFVEEWCRFERNSMRPAMFRLLLLLDMDIDVRPVLDTISVPSLVLHRKGDLFVPRAVARDLADRIPGARFVELPGSDHLFMVDPDQIADEIEEFLTGIRPEPEPDRVLATVLFTDIVGSTDRLVELGDRRWGELVERHDTLVRRHLARHRGRELKTLGDGFLASFDGPARAVRCACAIRDEAGTLDLSVRAGIHTGECEVTGDDLRGLAVNLAARVSATAGPDQVLTTSTVRELVAGSGIDFADRGEHQLKGLPGRWTLLEATVHQN